MSGCLNPFVFISQSSSPTYNYFRLEIYSNNGSNDDIYEFSIVAGGLEYPLVALTGDSAPSPYIAAASAFTGSNNPWKAFNKNTADKWTATASGVRYLEIYVGATGISPTAYKISASSSSGSPKNFAVLGKPTGGSYTGLDSQINQTWSGGVSTRTYTLPTGVRKKYFFVKILSNNGGTSLLFADLRINTDIAFPDYMTSNNGPTPFTLASAPTNSTAYVGVDGSIASAVSYSAASLPLLLTFYGGEGGWKKPTSISITAGSIANRAPKNVELWWGDSSDMSGAESLGAWTLTSWTGGDTIISVVT